jgi:hypothetical protein
MERIARNGETTKPNHTGGRTSETTIPETRKTTPPSTTNTINHHTQYIRTTLLMKICTSTSKEILGNAAEIWVTQLKFG